MLEAVIGLCVCVALLAGSAILFAIAYRIFYDY